MDFHQNGAVTTLHNLGLLPLEQLEKELKLFSGYRPMELVLPSLYSEIEGPALPKIVEELSRVNYLSHITIGLDRATRAEFDKAKNFFSKLKIPHTVIWNDGPKVKQLLSELEDSGLNLGEPGKGRNVWTCVGYVLARGKAEVLALHDCDILTYKRELLGRLLFPIANPNFQFEFCKGYYARVGQGKLDGRGSPPLIGPLLAPLESNLGHSDYLNFMKSFRYPLSGEFALRSNLLSDLRIPFDWGLEMGILSEMYRNQAINRVCQAEICDHYDHKHQDLSVSNPKAGLSRMSNDIVNAVLRKLATQGHSFGAETLRSLKAAYYRYALDAVDQYKADAAFNGLKLDLNVEESAVELFAKNIMKAGDSFHQQPMAVPSMPTWSRVLSAHPDFFYRMRLAIEEDNNVQRIRAA